MSFINMFAATVYRTFDTSSPFGRIQNYLQTWQSGKDKYLHEPFKQWFNEELATAMVQGKLDHLVELVDEEEINTIADTNGLPEGLFFTNWYEAAQHCELAKLPMYFCNSARDCNDPAVGLSWHNVNGISLKIAACGALDDLYQ